MEHLVEAVSYASTIFASYLLGCQVSCDERKELIGVAMFNKFDDRTKQIAIIEDFSRFFSEVINTQQRIVSNLFESWEILYCRYNFSYIDNPHARFVPMPELLVVEKFEMVTSVEPIYALLKRSHQRSLAISALAAEHNSYYEKFLATGEVKCIDDEVPFELPDGWEWARMGSIGDWGAGATPAKGNSSYYGGDILWLRTGELNDGVVYDTEIKVTQKALAECSLRINRVGDVLIAMYGATIGKVAIVGKELTTNQACCACTPYDIYKWFLFYFLMGSKDDFVKKGEGGAQPNISREKLIHHLMPIPPLAEQYRIVEKIKEVLPYIEQYESSQNSLNALNDNIKPLLKKSILQEAIQGRLVPQIEEEGTAEELLEGIRAEKKRLVKEGKQKASALKEESRIFKGADNKYHQNINGEDVVIDDILPFEIPSKWCWVSLGELVSDRTGLSYKKESLSDRTEPFVRVLRGGNIEDGEMLIKADDVMISSSYVSADLLLKKGMYISPAVSSLEKIGKTALVAKNYNDTVVGGFVLMLLPLFNDEWLGQYLYYFFQTGYYQNYCRTITKKSGQAFYNLSRPKLILCPVPLPPKQEIPRIVERLNIVLASIMRG